MLNISDLIRTLLCIPRAYVTCPPALPARRLVLSACGDRVRVYSSDTGEVVGLLLGHSAPVTELLNSPLNPDQVRALIYQSLVIVRNA